MSATDSYTTPAGTMTPGTPTPAAKTPDAAAPQPSPWRAVHNETPGAPHRLTVSGEVETPTPGWKLHLTKAQPQGINPEILLLRLERTAPTGIVPQHVVHVPVTFEETTTVPYKQVQIEPDGVTIEVINIL